MSATPPPAPRVLSGIQPSGALHIGNYFGAIVQHIALQDRYPGQAYYFIADYHALTTLRDPARLRENVFDAAVTYLSLGLDPARSLLFRQSDIPEVHELAWLLACVTGMGLMERSTSYKDKIAQGIKPSAGLFNYPLLMAADILIYDGTLVPVGKDQLQHVEFAQDMATYLNEAYAGDGPPLLVRPEAILGTAPIVPGSDGRKMSKSYGNLIPLFESGKKLRKLVGQIVTDSTPLGQPLHPDTCNVYGLLKLFADEAEQAQIAGWYRAGARDGQPFGYGHAKMLLADKIDAHFAPARARREHLLQHPDEVEAVLRDSAARARPLARATIDRCRRAVGLT
ncbi:tryptophan--tRNA ligase [Nannocystis sp. SCPEA4]|uniref:tryptophan--tRNA ligase n=1 Tax=Nannocystis sp. SCPEA4 TaxID=2996787 RepID=UPI002271FFF5|nr:tryptophan--tRNA ligase [Nannocystis sp. SCPEA4]MCY1062945.1 tryptophan--tRNA ligase [Nannocystis sp. SCPEA4]